MQQSVNQLYGGSDKWTDEEGRPGIAFHLSRHIVRGSKTAQNSIWKEED